jgi:hypothetical protein
MIYVLAFLFVALLVFIYFETKQYIGVIRHLTRVISDLKAFSMGKPEEKDVTPNPMKPPSDPDFGLGEVLEEADEALRVKDQEEILNV